jgi:ketosteroid isomerase-like protein
MGSDIDVLESFFAAINRNDMAAVASHFDPRIVRIEFEGSPTAGSYHGIAEVRENVRAGRGTWAEGRCEPERFLVAGERVVVYLHAWVRLHGATDWTGGRFADGFVLRNGKITEYRSFGERAHALRWAGIDADCV